MVGLLREELSPLIPCEVAVGGFLGSILPRFQIEVEKRHTAAAVTDVVESCGQCFAVRAEREAPHAPFGNHEGPLREPPEQAGIPEYHTAGVAIARVVSRGQGLAIGTEVGQSACLGQFSQAVVLILCREG